MAGKSQQDAQEYYMMLVDKLHETIEPSMDSKGRCHCFFHKAFFGRLQSEVTCDGCGTVSRTQDPFSAISLDFQKQVRRKKKAIIKMSDSAIPDLHSALQSYTSPEVLPAEEYTCRGCGVPKSASKRLRIRKLPAILCIQVKRFGGRMAGGSYLQEKHEGKIDFPMTIDMEPYTARKKSQKAESLVYDLESVIVHHGQQLQNGHYFAFCRQDDRWFKFDDEIVSVSTTEEVLRQEAYLLFYSLRCLNVL
jgi:ubiquitin carboxyl-terminal hydrolase 22/27/51